MIKRGPECAASRSDMPHPRRLRTLTMLVVFSVIGTFFVVSPQSAKADANAPRWTTGDFWFYVETGDPNHTLRVEVVGRESIRTLRGATYDAWHVKETEITGSIGVTTDQWIRDSDLGIVNSS